MGSVRLYKRWWDESSHRLLISCATLWPWKWFIHPPTCLLASVLWQLMDQIVVPLSHSTASQEVITKTNPNPGTPALFAFLSFLGSPIWLSSHCLHTCSWTVSYSSKPLETSLCHGLCRVSHLITSHTIHDDHNNYYHSTTSTLVSQLRFKVVSQTNVWIESCQLYRWGSCTHEEDDRQNRSIAGAENMLSLALRSPKTRLYPQFPGCTLSS